MSYDLTRLRLHGLIQRLPRCNTYVPPATASASPSSTPNSKTGSYDLFSTPTNHPKIEVRRALRTLEAAVSQYV